MQPKEQEFGAFWLHLRRSSVLRPPLSQIDFEFRLFSSREVERQSSSYSLAFLADAWYSNSRMSWTNNDWKKRRRRQLRTVLIAHLLLFVVSFGNPFRPSCCCVAFSNLLVVPKSVCRRRRQRQVEDRVALSTNNNNHLAATTSSSSYPTSPFDVPSLQGNITIPRSDDGRDILTHIRWVDASLRKWTGRGVVERMGLLNTNIVVEDNSVYETIYNDNRYVLITHGTEVDPIYNFGNRAALTAFWRSWDNLVELPSAQSVVLQSQDEVRRKELMRQVTEQNYVDDATGIRIRDDGTFLRLVDAVVWNCINDEGIAIGQAAFFDREQCPILESVDDD